MQDYKHTESLTTTGTTYSAAFSYDDDVPTASLDSQLVLANFAGTAPTLDVSLEFSMDGSNWVAGATAHAQLTADGTNGANNAAPIMTQFRWKIVAGGTAVTAGDVTLIAVLRS